VRSGAASEGRGSRKSGASDSQRGGQRGSSSFGQEGFNFEDFQKRVINGDLDFKQVFADFGRLGSRENITQYFQDQMRKDPEAYMGQLNAMRQSTMNDKRTVEMKQMYKADGEVALQLEYKDEYDALDNNLVEKLIKLEGTPEAKRYLAKGDREAARREYRNRYVKDKTEHFIQMVDESQFNMMETLVTGKGLKIPEAAIISRRGANKDEDDDLLVNTHGRTLSAAEREQLIKNKIKKCEEGIREALARNDKEKLDELIKKIKDLRGVDDFGNEKKK
jgi:hypothetical protein